MATNMTEKDKALNEIIEYCNTQANASRIRGEIAQEYGPETVIMSYFRSGQESAWESLAKHCEKMLGYSGQMPSEVLNQSGDAK